MSTTARKTSPGVLARGFAWAVAALLALTLMLAAFGGVALWALNSKSLREKVATDDALIRKETEWAGQRIRELGAVYGFDPAPVMVILDREMLEKQNLAGLDWLAAMLNSMKPGGNPEVDEGEIEEKLSMVLRFPDIKDQDELQKVYGEAASKITGVIQNATFSIRHQITDKGLEKAREMADVLDQITEAERMAGPKKDTVLAQLLADKPKKAKGARNGSFRAHMIEDIENGKA